MKFLKCIVFLNYILNHVILHKSRRDLILNSPKLSSIYTRLREFDIVHICDIFYENQLKLFLNVSTVLLYIKSIITIKEYLYSSELYCQSIIFLDPYTPAATEIVKIHHYSGQYLYVFIDIIYYIDVKLNTLNIVYWRTFISFLKCTEYFFYVQNFSQNWNRIEKNKTFLGLYYARFSYNNTIWVNTMFNDSDEFQT